MGTPLGGDALSRRHTIDDSRIRRENSHCHTLLQLSRSARGCQVGCSLWRCPLRPAVERAQGLETLSWYFLIHFKQEPVSCRVSPRSVGPSPGCLFRSSHPKSPRVAF